MKNDAIIETAVYEVLLYLDGVLIGDIRQFAQNLKWGKRRTFKGADEISFTVNDKIFSEWCKERNGTLDMFLRPLAVECRVKRNGVEVVGGFLASTPSYKPVGASADLDFQFDGWLNLLDGVHIYPIGNRTGALGTMIAGFIDEMNTRSRTAGKEFGFKRGSVQALASITNTFENYKTVKEFITDRCDNETGAGKFDVYFHPDKTYDIKADASFGDVITDYTIRYPASINSTSAVSLSAGEIQGFASKTIAIGNGEVSYKPAENTAPVREYTDVGAVQTYGYYETILQESSVSNVNLLAQKAQNNTRQRAYQIWSPEIELLGRQVAPTPSGYNKIWVGDTINIKNEADQTGMTSGQFRVDELMVDVEATGAEKVKPTITRVE